MFITTIFLCLISTAIIFYLLSQKSHSVVTGLPNKRNREAEERSFQRTENAQSVRVFAKFSENDKLRDALIVDYSPGGLGILIGDVTEQQVRKGNYLAIKSRQREHDWTLLQIKHITPIPGGYQIGCSFSENIHPSIIKNFKSSKRKTDWLMR